jgi:hypothetical protein
MFDNAVVPLDAVQPESPISASNRMLFKRLLMASSATATVPMMDPPSARVAPDKSINTAIRITTLSARAGSSSLPAQIIPFGHSSHACPASPFGW